MSHYEYKVVPAPARGIKTRGLRTPEDRFAGALSDAINAEAAEGWDYLRAETLPCEERTGWLSSRTTTLHHTLLVFRRAVTARPQPEVPPMHTPVATGMEGLRAIPSRTQAAPAQRREPPVPFAPQDIAAQPPRGPAPPRPVRRED